MKLIIALPLAIISPLTNGYETIFKSLTFPPPTPLYNASRGYCTAEERDQCSLDDVVLSSPSDKVQAVEASEPPEPPKIDYS
jgi:hypothetical protein